ncbi:FAD/FMN-dependent dehydrogenase [Frankia sp. AiPs1]|uniref:FAD-binding oxidoreductase n=1 Tax=Frankia sp. AiPa1 TaxID=573492 RepID=UPI00202B544F|nr:FAD-binding oxidoreductase [Frankia sp. AiPa1]MCL9760745.1 FAD-binding oxidoreductase [Frankia sp. AiPa1]
MGVPDRRSVLRAAGAGALGLGGLTLGGAILAGCQDDPGQPSQPGPSGTSGPSGDSGPSGSPDWAALESRLTGPLLRPGSPGYTTASQLYDPAFDTIRPAAVARAASPADVTACVDFARQTELPITARAGGHSYGGYSSTTGLVVDVTEMSTVTTAADGTARIGAGALLVDVYDRLGQAGRALPAGSCPTVGIAGLSLGGGIGVLSRRHGLTCDRMLSADVVLASGELVHTDADHDADLFWALRGGGGGNVGIVTSFTFATHEATPLVLFTCHWPWSAAADVLAAWQRWISDPGGAPDTVWSSCVLSSAPRSGVGGTPVLRLSGVSCGGSDDAAIAGLRTVLAGLADAAGHQPSSTSVGRRDHRTAMLIEAGCAGMDVAACHLRGRTAGGTLPRIAQRAASAFLLEPISAAGISTLLGTIEQRQRTAGAGSAAVILDAWGGEINRVAPGDTAFVHRSAIASAQYVAGYSINDSTARKDANQGWLRSTVAAMAPFVSASAYQNYIDPELAHWDQAYYGDNLARLRRVKRAYDPDDLLHFAQGVTPA